MKAKFLFAVAAAALFAGCFKDVSYKTNYVLKPLVQSSSGNPSEPFEGLKAYAFDADTNLYTVASYEDALGGIITRKDNPSERISTPVAVAEPYELEGTSGWMQMPLSSPSQMIVAVYPDPDSDPKNQFYAYTQQELLENLPTLYVSLVFETWKEGYSFKGSRSPNWSFYHPSYEPPPSVVCYIDPSVQRAEGGEQTPVEDLKAYAYAVDTTAWYIASYNDAVAGKITPKEEGSPLTTPNFLAYPEQNSSRYEMVVTSPTLMVVVVDRTNRLYAYSKQEVDLAGEPVNLPIVFRTWLAEWITVDGSWRIVNEALAPEDPNPLIPAGR